MSLILMTTLFYKALILQGEIWCWSNKGVLVSKDEEYIKVGSDVFCTIFGVVFKCFKPLVLQFH